MSRSVYLQWSMPDGVPVATTEHFVEGEIAVFMESKKADAKRDGSVVSQITQERWRELNWHSRGA